MATIVVVWPMQSRDSRWVKALRERDFWFRYHAVDEHRLDDTHRFVLPWNDRFEFKLDTGPEELTFSLIEPASGKDHVLGWWDDARWHPFALRWGELLTLLQGWEKRSDVLDAPFPLLLLGRFVGFGVEETAKHVDAARLVAEAYRGLGFSASDVSQLTAKSLPVADEKDYRWTRDAELGWLFGGEYACYSLRNREHRGSEEGQFPFAAVRDLFSDGSE